MAKDRMLILHFVDGNKLSFDFPEQTGIAAGKQIKFEDFLKGNHLVVEVEGSLLVFPVHNIKYIQLTLPGKGFDASSIRLPPHTIRGAVIR